MLFSQIAEHEEWCKKDKCANKQCQKILEFCSRRQFQHKDKTIQVCDDICYQMYRLQQVMRMGDQTEVLLFIEQYFNDQEEMDNEIKRKQQKESE